MERFSEVPHTLLKTIEEFSLSYLSQGRKEWDEPHTRAVVYYAEEIAKSEGEDVLVLVTAAWLHDAGYHALFEDSDSKDYESVMDRKAMHMVNGARLAEEFLETPEVASHYSQEQKERIIHLVGIHDKVEELKDKDEIILMEADTLGAIDVGRVATTFNLESAMKYISKDLYGRRVLRFQTALGIDYFKQLIGPFIGQFKKD